MWTGFGLLGDRFQWLKDMCELVGEWRVQYPDFEVVSICVIVGIWLFMLVADRIYRGLTKYHYRGDILPDPKECLDWLIIGLVQPLLFVGLKYLVGAAAFFLSPVLYFLILKTEIAIRRADYIHYLLFVWPELERTKEERIRKCRESYEQWWKEQNELSDAYQARKVPGWEHRTVDMSSARTVYTPGNSTTSFKPSSGFYDVHQANMRASEEKWKYDRMVDKIMDELHEQGKDTTISSV